MKPFLNDDAVQLHRSLAVVGGACQASANCRLEGTCACLPSRQHARTGSSAPALGSLSAGSSDVHEQKKPWVPLMLEASYRPSGWLGIMCVPAAGQWPPCAWHPILHTRSRRVALSAALRNERAHHPWGLCSRGLGCLCQREIQRRSLCVVPVLAPAVGTIHFTIRAAYRLGSRLYFEFTAAALGDGAAWEGLADGVAVEVRRHGAPAPADPQSAPPAPAATAVTAHDGSREPSAGEFAPPPVMALAPTSLAAPTPGRGGGAPAGVSVNSVHVDNRTTNHTNTNSNIGNRSQVTIGNTSLILL